MDFSTDTTWLEACMARFWRVLQEHPELLEEFEARAPDFHGAELLPGDERSEEAALRRRLEWFLFELDRGARGSVAELVWDEWRQGLAEEPAERSELLLESWTGVFEVLERGEATYVVQELAGLARVHLRTPADSPDLAVGELLVGRVFPVGDGTYLLSPAAGVFRNPELRTALHRDLERMRQGGAQAILRLSQAELERMFFAMGSTEAPPQEPERSPEEVLEELTALLAAGGVAPALVGQWIEVLRRTPWRPEALVSGVGDAVGAILDELAFQTDVDLDRARSLLLEGWSGLHRDRARRATEEQPASPRGGDSVLDSLREFDRDRAAGLDLESSFRELERRLGIEPETEGNDPEAPDFPGVVGAMVEEYLWETEREHGEERRRAHEGLRAFGGYTEGLGVFENLSARDFLSFATFWIPESRRLKSGAEAERLVEALGAFGRWAAESQGLDDLREPLEEHFAHLSENLARAVVANALLVAEGQEDGELFEFLRPEAAGSARVRDQAGEEREVAFETRLLGVLESGDLLRGHTRQDGVFVVSCCYPPEAAALRTSKA